MATDFVTIKVKPSTRDVLKILAATQREQMCDTVHRLVVAEMKSVKSAIDKGPRK